MYIVQTEACSAVLMHCIPAVKMWLADKDRYGRQLLVFLGGGGGEGVEIKGKGKENWG
jgi:hypothetical protein